MIVVTAPTGNIGRQVVQRLLDAGAAVRVVARDPSRLRPDVRDRVEVVPGSHGDPGVVKEAVTDADAVFWLAPSNPAATTVHESYLDFTRPAAEAFVSQGVGRVVGVSALGRGTPMAAHAGLVTASLAMDDLIAATGVPYRALTMPSFMDNLTRQAASIRDQGVFFQPQAGDLKRRMCATADIAAVATRLLLDDTWTGSGEVPVLGPEDLSFEDMAVVLSQVLGRPVAFRRIPGEAFRDRLVANGMSPVIAQAMLDMALAKDAGLDNAQPRTPEATTPTTFRTWATEVLAPLVRG